MTEDSNQPIHATCVALKTDARDWAGALFFGASGSGKSDLALRFLHGLGPERCRLVADDYVSVSVEGEHIKAAAPAVIAGRMEVRGVGLVNVATMNEVPLALAFDLVAREEVLRIPQDHRIDLASFLEGEESPLLSPLYRLAAFDASASAKVEIAFRMAAGNQPGLHR